MPQIAGLLTGILLATPAFAADPVVDSFTAAPTAVEPGGTIALTLAASDPDCAGTCTSGCGEYIRSDLTSWMATGGSFTATDVGTSGSPYTTTAVWEAPLTEGTYTLSVYIADSGSFFCGGRGSIEPSLDIQVTTNTGNPPTVDSLTSDNTLLFPGDRATLSCRASDPDDDPITYSWTTDSGTIAGAGDTAVFTAGAYGLATVTCRATDATDLFAEAAIGLAVTSAVSEGAVTSGMVTPQRLAVSPEGNLYVADRSAGGVVVVNLFTDEVVYEIPYPEISTVALDWNGNLLVGSRRGAEILDRFGNPLVGLGSSNSIGDVSDVAVDHANQRYGVLHRRLAKVVVYDAAGTPVVSFGSNGAGAEQFKSPAGLAATPEGDWLVADTGHGLIKRFDGSGVLTYTFGGLGAGAGEFVQLDDVAVDATGVIFATDSFASWIQSFEPNGTVREVFGGFGSDPGQFKTPTGVAPVEGYDRLVAASLNTSSLQVFRTSSAPTGPVPTADGETSPTHLDFLAQPVGSTSPSQVVVLTNLGDALLGVREITVNDAFAASHDCPKFLDAGQDCSILVTFTPAAPGSHLGTLIVDTSETGPKLGVALSGNAFVPADLALSRTFYEYPDQEVGTVSESVNVTATNVGTVPLALAGIFTSEQYGQTNDCGPSLGPGASCEIRMTFEPTEEADHIPGSLTVLSAGASSPHVVTLDGRGVGGPRTLAIADAESAEGDTGTSEIAFTLTLSTPSDGTVSVDWETVADTATAEEDFLPASGNLLFLEGSTTGTVTVDIVGDEILEPDAEWFALALSNPVGASLEAAEATGTILDDELCPGPNQVVNGGAEASAPGGGITGWQTIQGAWELRREAPLPYAGDACFSAAAVPLAELAQDIDLAAYADRVDEGELWLGFAAQVQTAEGGRARVIGEYLDATRTFVLDGFDTGEMESPGVWSRIEDVRVAPHGARWVRIRLLATAEPEGPPAAYFDGVELWSERIAAIWVEGSEVYEGDFGTTDLPFTVRLACPYHEEVRATFTTVDGNAIAGEDYLPTTETVVLEPGQTEQSVPVEVWGDTDDEPHEALFGVLEPDDPDAVVLEDEALGILVNDDFCARTPTWWRQRPEDWPATGLTLGDVLYDAASLDILLGYSGNNAPAKLARELVAAKFNLLIGSDPEIVPVVEQADAYLTIYPPGSKPGGRDKRIGNGLKERLGAYNDTGCVGDMQY